MKCHAKQCNPLDINWHQLEINCNRSRANDKTIEAARTDNGPTTYNKYEQTMTTLRAGRGASWKCAAVAAAAGARSAAEADVATAAAALQLLQLLLLLLLLQLQLLLPAARCCCPLPLPLPSWKQAAHTIEEPTIRLFTFAYTAHTIEQANHLNHGNTTSLQQIRNACREDLAQGVHDVAETTQLALRTPLQLCGVAGVPSR